MSAQLAPLSPTRGYCNGKPTRAGVPNRKGVLTVEAVRSLYEAGHTQDEIAERLDVSQYKISYFMKRNGIPTRVAAKRNQRGENNHVWTGDNASYVACHKRVHRLRGSAFGCGVCGSKEDKLYHWANLTGDYLDVMDFMSMCVKCHRKFDNDRRKANGGVSTITR